MNNQELRIVVAAKDAASLVIKKVQRQLDNSSSEMRRGLNRASDAASGFTGRLDISAKSAALMGAVAGATASAVTALGRSVKSVASSAIDGAGNFEQYRVAFETMLGSADKARMMLQDISQFAKTTPFELTEVVTASKQLLAFGIAQADIIPTMRRLGDIAAGVGVPVGQLAYVFGQVRVAGKLMGGDLMQFTNAGVPMIEGLAKVLKVSQSEVKQMVEQGKVGFAEVDQVIRNMTDSGSKFGGMMDKQSKTFKGVVSNIKDGFQQVLLSAVGVTTAGDIIENGLFDRIKGAAERAMPAVQRAAERVGPAMQTALMGVDAFFAALKDPDVTSDGFVGMMERIGSKIRHVADDIAGYLGPKLSALWHTVRDELIPTLGRLWREVLVPLIPVIGTAFVVALGLAIDALNLFLRVATPVMNFLIDHEWILWAVAGAFGAIKAALFLKGAVAAFSAAMDSTVAKAGWAVVKMTAHALVIGAKWAAQAAVAAAAWTAEMARVVASSAVSMVKMLPHAADVGLAWIINATRVSFVWVTQTMPRIIASFVATSVSASIHAVRTSAVWIANATRSAIAWTITEMPKVVSSFIITSGQAVVHAGVASAAWIASASKSAVAWVVTELPKIIAAFVTTSGAAVLHAATASAAWVGAAVQSTASFQSFAALISTPLVMPAIAIGAAIAAIATVQAQYNELQRVMDKAMNTLDKHTAMNDSRVTTYQGIKQRAGQAAADKFWKDQTPIMPGISDKDQKKLAQEWMNAKPRWTGGYVGAGQTYDVGERGRETFVPNTSGRIDPQAATGETKNILSGTFIFNNQESVDAFFMRLDKTQRLARMGLA